MAKAKGKSKAGRPKKKATRGLWFKAQKEFGKGRISKKSADYQKVKKIYERLKKEAEKE